MVRFYASSTKPEGCVGIILSKYQTSYRASVDFAGEMTIEKISNDNQTEKLASKQIQPPEVNKPTHVKFANVDHQLLFWFGSEKLSHDLGPAPDDAGRRKTDIDLVSGTIEGEFCWCVPVESPF